MAEPNDAARSARPHPDASTSRPTHGAVPAERLPAGAEHVLTADTEVLATTTALRAALLSVNPVLPLDEVDRLTREMSERLARGE